MTLSAIRTGGSPGFEESPARPDRVVSRSGGLNVWQLALIFAAAFVLLFLRRPDALTNPQFCAEDGVWYAQAYNWSGWSELPVPIAGYLHVVPRLIARISLLVPLRWAPLVFNLFALSFMVFPVLLLLSRRFSAIPLGARALLALGYLLLPNCQEIHGTVTSLQWHLAPLGLLTLLAEPTASRAGRVLDGVVIAFCAVSGAFALLLLPIAFLVFWRRRTGAALVPVVLLLAGAALLPVVAKLNVDGRPSGPLAATPALVAHILGGRVFLSSLIGQRGFDAIVTLLSWPALQRIVWLSGALGLGVLAFALLKGPRSLRLFVLFSSAVLAGALAFPMASSGAPQYPLLALHGGGRYWFFPMMAFLASLGWIAATAPRPVRVAALALLLLMPIGIVVDFRHEPFVDMHWPEEVARFEAAEKGTLFHMTIYPPGWKIPIARE
jgi:hypothetical protein